MTNHVHLLLTPTREGGLSRMMQLLNRRFVRAMNHLYGRTGTLWEGRYRSSLIDTEAYLLTCYRYIELNPVRAGMVDDPNDYPWSSYRYHASGKANELIVDHECYLALGPDEKSRSTAYRALFRTELDQQGLEAVRSALNKGIALGNDHFKDEVEKRLGQRVRPAKMGRPKKEMGQATRC
jgi:putative transposase